MKAFLIGALGFLFMAPFNIAGDSMEPLLAHNDTAMFESLTYMLEEPQRGDVVVFYGTDEPDKIFVKRIVGLPGETLWLQEEKVFIIDREGNEMQLEESYVNNDTHEYSLRQMDGTRYEVPQGKYFVLGDNRRSSFDSRTWHDPFVPEENLVGKYYYTLF